MLGLLVAEYNEESQEGLVGRSVGWKLVSFWELNRKRKGRYVCGGFEEMGRLKSGKKGEKVEVLWTLLSR